MNINKENFIKYITIFIFIIFIFIFPILNLILPDKTFNEIENKLLTKLPKFSIYNIFKGSFMENFDNYSSDQFPFRNDFISLKNYYNYIIGNREFKDIYIGKDNRLMEKFIFNLDNIDKNISQVTLVSEELNKNFNISSKLVIIPTSIAFYKNTLPSWAISDKQSEALTYIETRIKNDFPHLGFYTPYKILEKHKKEYIYFNTDHHWTQLGAKLAYEEMYNTKIDSKNYHKISDDFYGTYYSKVLLPKIKSDSIYAFTQYDNYKIEVDNTKKFNTLYDKSKLKGKNKYQYFLHGDPAFSIITGNEKIKSEILIFKDSYAHNFIPFLTNNYSKIHIIDPRYSNLNIHDYILKNKNIKEVLFINNIETFNNSNLYKNL